MADRKCAICRHAEWDNQKRRYWCRELRRFVDSDDKCMKFQ